MQRTLQSVDFRYASDALLRAAEQPDQQSSVLQELYRWAWGIGDILNQRAEPSTTLVRGFPEGFRAPSSPRDLARITERTLQVLRALAKNPNLPPALVHSLFAAFPEEVLVNPIFPMLLLEQPNFLIEPYLRATRPKGMSQQLRLTLCRLPPSMIIRLIGQPQLSFGLDPSFLATIGSKPGHLRVWTNCPWIMTLTHGDEASAEGLALLHWKEFRAFFQEELLVWREQGDRVYLQDFFQELLAMSMSSRQ